MCFSRQKMDQFVAPEMAVAAGFVGAGFAPDTAPTLGMEFVVLSELPILESVAIADVFLTILPSFF